MIALAQAQLACGSSSCHDGDDECDPKARGEWRVQWSNVLLAPTGLIVLTDTKDGNRYVFVCNEKNRCDDDDGSGARVLIKLIPAAKERTLIDPALARPPVLADVRR